MSPFGTFETLRDVRSLVAIGGKADISQRSVRCVACSGSHLTPSRQRQKNTTSQDQAGQTCTDDGAWNTGNGGYGQIQVPTLRSQERNYHNLIREDGVKGGPRSRKGLMLFNSAALKKTRSTLILEGPVSLLFGSKPRRKISNVSLQQAGPSSTGSFMLNRRLVCTPIPSGQSNPRRN